LLAVTVTVFLPVLRVKVATSAAKARQQDGCRTEPRLHEVPFSRRHRLSWSRREWNGFKAAMARSGNLSFVISGRAKREPGIHNHRRE
jgi:hypothetical protein